MRINIKYEGQVPHGSYSFTEYHMASGETPEEVQADAAAWVARSGAQHSMAVGLHNARTDWAAFGGQTEGYRFIDDPEPKPRPGELSPMMRVRSTVKSSIKWLTVAVLTCAIVIIGAGITIGMSRPPAAVNVPNEMGDVDTWAGLSVAVRAEKPGPRDAAKTCLALNAYHEARGEGWAGQVAVGQVALRRAGLDFNHVCKEIFRPGQFSWTVERPRHGALPAGVAWQWALAAAEEALQWAAHPEARTDYSNRATYFHATSVRPYWTRGLELVAMIGEHRFYR